jgi:hypothetical protein
MAGCLVYCGNDLKQPSKHTRCHKLMPCASQSMYKPLMGSKQCRSGILTCQISCGGTHHRCILLRLPGG